MLAVSSSASLSRMGGSRRNSSFFGGQGKGVPLYLPSFPMLSFCQNRLLKVPHMNMCFICTKYKKGLNETDDDSVMQRIANRSFVKEKNNFLVCLDFLLLQLRGYRCNVSASSVN